METICNFFPEINVHIGQLSAESVFLAPFRCDDLSLSYLFILFMFINQPQVVTVGPYQMFKFASVYNNYTHQYNNIILNYFNSRYRKLIFMYFYFNIFSQ